MGARTRARPCRDASRNRSRSLSGHALEWRSFSCYFTHPPSAALVLPPAIGRVCLNHSKTATRHASSIHFSRASHPPSVWIVIFFQLPLSAMPRTSVVPSSQSRNFAAARQHPKGNCSPTCWQGSMCQKRGRTLAWPSCRRPSRRKLRSHPSP